MRAVTAYDPKNVSADLFVAFSTAIIMVSLYTIQRSQQRESIFFSSQIIICRCFSDSVFAILLTSFSNPDLRLDKLCGFVDCRIHRKNNFGKVLIPRPKPKGTGHSIIWMSEGFFRLVSTAFVSRLHQSVELIIINQLASVLGRGLRESFSCRFVVILVTMKTVHLMDFVSVVVISMVNSYHNKMVPLDVRSHFSNPQRITRHFFSVEYIFPKSDMVHRSQQFSKAPWYYGFVIVIPSKQKMHPQNHGFRKS